MKRPLILTALVVAATLSGCATSSDSGSRTGDHTETILVQAGRGLEWKVHMDEGDHMLYEWSANVPLYFDFHGEPERGGPNDFSSHKLGDSDADRGQLVAPFTGTHGWYWENQGDVDATLELTLEGTFTVVGFV